MFRFAAVALLLSATAAQAETAGADFCEVLRAQSTACIYEAGTRSGGDYLRKCDNADAAVQAAHKTAMSHASDALQLELGSAATLWKKITTSPLPSIGETPEAYKSRKRSERDEINAECEKLARLDHS